MRTLASGRASPYGVRLSRHEHPGIRRLAAFAVDWLIIVLWGGLLFGAVMLLSGGNPAMTVNPWKAQLIGFVSMTLPVTLYFAIAESSRFGATLGKRVLGLRVRSVSGEQLSGGRSLARNAVKFIPWEFGHLVAQQAIHAGVEGVPLWLYAPMVISMLLPLWWVVSLLRSGVAPYDGWVGARVDRGGRRPR
jgi:uncharacterized RDD family membrane protein YckC